MARRTAKTKKTSSTKVAEIEVPKKGRGKTKTEEEPDIDAVETEMGDAPVIDKKNKRAKKDKAEINGNGLEESNGVSEEAPPAKKGRKKKADTPEDNGTENSDEDKVSNIDDETEAKPDSNGQTEEVPASGGRSKKKPAKKEVAKKPKTEPKPSARGKKNTKQETESEVLDKEEASDDLVKPASKGRGRKAPQKADKKSETQENGDEDEKVKESPKGRKRGQTKPAKENTPENEQGEEDEEPKKKEPKGRKNNTKKQAKEENDQEEDTKQEPASKKRKVAKKDGKDEVKQEEAEEVAPEPKTAKGKRGKKEALEPEEAGDTASKRRRKAADEKVPSEDKKSKAPPKNKASTNYEEIDFSNTSKTKQGKDWNLKISSWNVDGIRAWMNKGGLDYIKYEKPDILCLQETKCSKEKLPEEIANLAGYHAYWQESEQDGYAGVGIYTTKLAISVQYGLGNKELDSEGRLITAEYEQFYLVCTYVPNAGRKLVTLPKRLQWNEEFRKFVKALEEKKPVIICGDMNVAHNEIDLSNPKANKKNAGFTAEEREGMTELLGDGFVDSFRQLRPDDAGAYTFWTYMMNARAKNVGWRLDYFLLSERLLPSLCDSVIRSDVYGSDHCPITLFLHVTSADKPKE